MRRDSKEFIEIYDILWDEYGVKPIMASSETVLWAAAKCENPEKSLSELNRERERWGHPLVYAPYKYFERLES